MKQDAVADDGSRRRRNRHKRRRKNRKLERLWFNLRWLFGGLAVGLPVMAILIYMASR